MHRRIWFVLLTLALVAGIVLAGCQTPEVAPTAAPQPTKAAPTEAPTEVPTEVPTVAPTEAPTQEPVAAAAEENATAVEVNDTTFWAIVGKVQTMADGGIRVYLDLPEDAIVQAAELMAYKRGAVVLDVTCRPRVENERETEQERAGSLG